MMVFYVIRLIVSDLRVEMKRGRKIEKVMKRKMLKCISGERRRRREEKEKNKCTAGIYGTRISARLHLVCGC